MKKKDYLLLPRSFKKKPDYIETDKVKSVFIRKIRSGEYICNFRSYSPLISGKETVKVCYLCINKTACKVSKRIWCNGKGFYPEGEFTPKYSMIENSSQLASSIGYTYSCLAGWVSKLNNEESNYYRKIVIKKKSGGMRVCYEPDIKLKMIQTAILNNILYPYIKLGKHVTGFCPSVNITDNATVHINKAVVQTLDIKDFFPNVHPAMVYNELRHIFTDHIAMMITRLCSYKNQMAQGIPTSPMLANLACNEMDKEIITLCKKRKWDYTRYADDMTFSTARGRNTVRRDTVDRFLKSVYHIVGINCFKINSKKTRIMRKGKRQMVTGIIVNEKANIPRQIRNNIRAIIHNCKTMGIDSQLRDCSRISFIRRIDGYMSFMKMVNETLWEKYIDDWDSAKKDIGA